MNTTEKGNELEHAFYEYLISQKRAEKLILGAHASERCSIHRKKKYPCGKNHREIEIDISIEVHRENSTEPTFLILIECKNYKNSVKEDVINGFSNTISRVSEHNTKGYVVFPSKIVKSAIDLAKSYGIGLIKFDEDGTDIIAERSFKKTYGTNYIQSSLLADESETKTLRFSATFDDEYYDSIGQLISSTVSSTSKNHQQKTNVQAELKFYNCEEIENIATCLLTKQDYRTGPVDLEKICENLGIELRFHVQQLQNRDGIQILGKAAFTAGEIHIYPHENAGRQRFTLSHEISHFCLNHGDFLGSETTIKSDLVIGSNNSNTANTLRKMEIQANLLASSLLLPRNHFIEKVDEFRIKIFGNLNRGHGYIYVDDQPDKRFNYLYLLDELSEYFATSRAASEIRLKKLVHVTDDRSSSPLINFQIKPLH